MSHHLTMLHRFSSTSVLCSKTVIWPLSTSSSSLARILCCNFKVSFSIKASLGSSIIWRGQGLHVWPPWARTKPGTSSLCNLVQGPRWRTGADPTQNFYFIPQGLKMFIMNLNVWKVKKFQRKKYFVTLEGIPNHIWMSINKVLSTHGPVCSQQTGSRQPTAQQILCLFGPS